MILKIMHRTLPRNKVNYSEVLIMHTNIYKPLVALVKESRRLDLL